jgi:hypothetical protein
MRYSRAGGKLIHEKNQRQKSRDTVPLGNFAKRNCPRCDFFPRTRSYKKEDEPLLNLRGYKQLLKREGTYVCTKEGIRVPTLNTGGSMCTR